MGGAGLGGVLGGTGLGGAVLDGAGLGSGVLGGTGLGGVVGWGAGPGSTVPGGGVSAAVPVCCGAGGGVVARGFSR